MKEGSGGSSAAGAAELARLQQQLDTLQKKYAASVETRKKLRELVVSLLYDPGSRQHGCLCRRQTSFLPLPPQEVCHNGR